MRLALLDPEKAAHAETGMAASSGLLLQIADVRSEPCGSGHVLKSDFVRAVRGRCRQFREILTKIGIS